MTVSYAPWAYGEIMASCAATLWLAALWRNQGAFWQRLCFGLSVGIGLWFSLQTLMIALPAVVWIALRRRGAMPGESLAAVFGAIAGATPFLAGNVSHGYPSLMANWASRPVASLPQAWDNFVWLISYMLPKLLFRSSGWWSETTLLIAAYAVAAAGFALALRRNARDVAPLLCWLHCVHLFFQPVVCGIESRLDGPLYRAALRRRAALSGTGYRRAVVREQGAVDGDRRRAADSQLAALRSARQCAARRPHETTIERNPVAARAGSGSHRNGLRRLFLGLRFELRQRRAGCRASRRLQLSITSATVQNWEGRRFVGRCSAAKTKWNGWRARLARTAGLRPTVSFRSSFPSARRRTPNGFWQNSERTATNP